MRLKLVTRPSVTATGTTTIGSAVVTVADTSLLAGSLRVSGPGIPIGSLVASIDSATQVTLTEEATATGSVSLIFTLEPVSLGEAKLQLRNPVDLDDPLVAGLIVTARMMCETELQRSFIATTWDLFLNLFPPLFVENFRETRWQDLPELGQIKIPRPSLISVDSVNYYDLGGELQVVDPATYVVSTGAPARLAPAYLSQWPESQVRIDAVRIRYASGYGATADDIPDCIKVGMKLLVSHLYENRGEADTPMPAYIADILAPENWGSC